MDFFLPSPTEVGTLGLDALLRARLAPVSFLHPLRPRSALWGLMLSPTEVSSCEPFASSSTEVGTNGLLPTLSDRGRHFGA